MHESPQTLLVCKEASVSLGFLALNTDLDFLSLFPTPLSAIFYWGHLEPALALPQLSSHTPQVLAVTVSKAHCGSSHHTRSPPPASPAYHAHHDQSKAMGHFSGKSPLPHSPYIKTNPRPASGPIAFVPKYFRRWPFLHSAFLFPSVMFKYLIRIRFGSCSKPLAILLLESCDTSVWQGQSQWLCVCEALNDVSAFCFSLLRGQYLKKKSKDK